MPLDAGALNSAVDLFVRLTSTAGRIWRALRDRDVPASTLRIVPRDGYHYWHTDIGPEGEEYAALTARLFVTSTLKNRIVRILGAKLSPKHIIGSVHVYPLPTTVGAFPKPELGAYRTGEFTVSFSVYPSPADGKPYIARITLIDQFGNPHRSARLTFHHRTSPLE